LLHCRARVEYDGADLQQQARTYTPGRGSGYRLVLVGRLAAGGARRCDSASEETVIKGALASQGQRELARASLSAGSHPAPPVELRRIALLELMPTDVRHSRVCSWASAR
jgi:hypothetical protein